MSGGFGQSGGPGLELFYNDQPMSAPPFNVVDVNKRQKDFDVACPNIARDWRNLKFD